MLLTSSEIQKKLERGAFLIHIAHKQIEALQAEIAGHEEKMYDTARSLYGNPTLVDAAIAMANMSIPAIEMKASKLVAESQQSSPASSSADQALSSILDPATSTNASDVDSDDSTADDDSPVVEPVPDGTGLAKLHTEEFFGVEVPASQIDLAREIKHEAAVSVKQNTKNNTYASDRGKNAWRKALFTRARAEYLKADASSEVQEDASTADLVEESDGVEQVVVETAIEHEVIVAEVAEPVLDAEVEEAAEADIEPVVEVDVSDDAVQLHADNDQNAVDQHDDADPAESDAVVSELKDAEPATDESVEVDGQWSPETEDDFISTPSDGLSETSSAGFVDIPFFDDPADPVDEDLRSGETETVSTVNDDQTLSIADTFFSDDDVAVLDPISFDEETGDHSDHDDMSSSDEPEDIDVPEFDPNAELFDGNTEILDVETPAVPAEASVEEVASKFLNERIAESSLQPTPEASRRAVPMSSIPAHQRPGAPRPLSSAPSRPQPGAASGRVVTTPAARPAPSATQQTAPEASSPAPVLAASTAAVAPAASAPSRGAPVRAAPARTHGYGAKVPAPPGLDEAIRERDAAEAAAKAAASTAPASAAPARPSAPVRPGPTAPRGPAFTKPTFGR